jgi:hypothetical protein
MECDRFKWSIIIVVMWGDVRWGEETRFFDQNNRESPIESNDVTNDEEISYQQMLLLITI